MCIRDSFGDFLPHLVALSLGTPLAFFATSGSTFPLEPLGTLGTVWNPLGPFEIPLNPFGDILPHLVALFWHFGDFLPNLVHFCRINFIVYGSTSLNSFQTALIRKRKFRLFWHFLALFGQKNVTMDTPRQSVKGSYSNIF